MGERGQRLTEKREQPGSSLTEKLEQPGSTEQIESLLTVKEACAATRLSKSKIYQLLDQGLLHRVRLPGCAKVLIAESELRRYIGTGIAAGAAK